VIDVRELTADEIERVDADLPLNRLCQYVEEGSTYLIAWDDDRPVGHAHIAWSGTRLGLPEIQDVFVLPDRRRSGVAVSLSEAAEPLARAAGWSEISLSVGEGNLPARRLYEKLGYVDAGVEPVRISGVISIRNRPVEVDDTLLYLKKGL
jgi:GNAT superfamily N-acetyltransferase